MTTWISPVTLHGRHVRLEPMTEVHIPALAEIGVGHPFWDFMVYGAIQSVEDMRDWVMDILSRAERGSIAGGAPRRSLPGAQHRTGAQTASCPLR